MTRGDVSGTTHHRTSDLKPEILYAFNPLPAPQSVWLEEQKNGHEGKRGDLFYAPREKPVQVCPGKVLQDPYDDATHNGPGHGIEPAQHHRRQNQ